MAREIRTTQEVATKVRVDLELEKRRLMEQFKTLITEEPINVIKFKSNKENRNGKSQYK